MVLKREVEVGRVVEFDGYNGIILGYDKNAYLLKKTEILGDISLKVGDKVVFEKELIKNLEIGDILVARFIKKYVSK